MTNTIALWLGGLILAILAADLAYFGWNLPVMLGREFVVLLDWLAFWR